MGSAYITRSYIAAAPVSRGMLLKKSTTGGKVAPLGTADSVALCIGVAGNDAFTGEPVAVDTLHGASIALYSDGSATIAEGDILGPSTSTAGAVKTVTSGGIALSNSAAPATAGALVPAVFTGGASGSSSNFSGVDLTAPGGYPDGSASAGSPGSRQLTSARRAQLLDSDGDLDIEASFISRSTDGTNSGDMVSGTSADGLLALAASANSINLAVRGGTVGTIGVGFMRWGHEVQCRAWYRPTKGLGGLRVRLNGCQIVTDVSITPSGGAFVALTDAWEGSRLGSSSFLSAAMNMVRAWRGTNPTAFLDELGIVGDSILADNSALAQPAVGMLIYKPAEARNRSGIYSIAHPGDTASAQKTAFDASRLKTATTLRAIVIQVGVNNVLAGQSIATALADIQALVTDCAAVAPVVLCQMTPCKAALTGGQYTVWQGVNQGINGGGATPITGATQIVTSHVAALGDGADNLAAAYNSGDNIHPNAAGRQVNAQAIRDALVTMGILSLY